MFGPRYFTGGFQMMGMLGALKTGDICVDMLIAMMAPIFLKFLFLIDWAGYGKYGWGNPMR